MVRATTPPEPADPPVADEPATAPEPAPETQTLLAVLPPYDSFDHGLDGAPALTRQPTVVPAELVDELRAAASNLGVHLHKTTRTAEKG